MKKKKTERTARELDANITVPSRDPGRPIGAGHVTRPLRCCHLSRTDGHSLSVGPTLAGAHVAVVTYKLIIISPSAKRSCFLLLPTNLPPRGERIPHHRRESRPDPARILEVGSAGVRSIRLSLFHFLSIFACFFLARF